MSEWITTKSGKQISKSSSWSNVMKEVYPLCHHCWLYNYNPEHPICLIGECDAAMLSNELANELLAYDMDDAEYDRAGDDAESEDETE